MSRLAKRVAKLGRKMLAWFKKRKRTKQPDEAESVEDLTIQVPTTQKQAAKKKKEKVTAHTEVCFDSWRSMALCSTIPCE